MANNDLTLPRTKRRYPTKWLWCLEEIMASG